ncbi:MAG: POTRA domain-containing protein [Chitinophagales bacterium]|nr:BamA/TamA family outer membrane protein [Chitinophagales bacterium]MDW8273838.1 POTRA domain-containing protein [Chitinophagales bacterium]
MVLSVASTSNKGFERLLLTLFLTLFAFTWCDLKSLFAQNLVVDYAQPAEYEIQEIKVEGAQYLDERILATLSGLRVGEKIKIPGEDIAKAIKNLWRQRLFSFVSIELSKKEKDKAWLLIRVEEKPRISRYTIKGVRSGDLEELKKKIDLRAGSILTESVKAQAANAIKAYYIDKGYLNVAVQVLEKKDTLIPNSVKVELWVNKGQRVKINYITFDGVQQVSANRLRRAMKETKEKVKFDLDEILNFKKNLRDSIWRKHPYKWLDISPLRIYEYIDRYANLNIFKSSKFKRKEYEDDKRKIIEYYHTQGFRDAAIVEDTVYQTDSRNLNIHLTVNEGKRYYFRNIYLTGNTKYSDSLIYRILNIKKGEVYNQKLLEEKLFMSASGNDLSSLYMDEGYLFFNVTPLEVKIEDDSIDVELRINEGPQATIKDVRIIGNTKTNEKVIRRELYTLPGNKFSRSDLLRSQRQIVNLGYFDPQQLDMVPIPNPEKGTVDIEYRVTEKPSDQLELSAGWGGARNQGGGLVGTLGLTFTNFSVRNIAKKRAWNPLPSGDGQRLSLRFQSTGARAQFYTLSFTEPWLGGRKPQSLTVSFNQTVLNALDVNFRIDGTYRATATTVAFGTRLKKPDDFFTAEVAMSYQYYYLRNYNFPFFIFQDGRSNNLNFSFNLSRNSIDAPLYPTRGALFDFTVSATLPYSYMFSGRRNIDYSNPELPNSIRYNWIEYHKWKFKVDWYVPVWKNLVLKTSAKFGFLGLYNPAIGYSPFERFELGGDGISNAQILGRDIVSLRGYQIISPDGGAPIYNKFSMEMRFPVSLNPSATIYGLAFLDGGNYWMNIRDYRPFDLRRSAGLGVRVFLPMFGLLGFDYGIGWDKIPKQGNNIFSKYGEFRIVLGFEPE